MSNITTTLIGILFLMGCTSTPVHLFKTDSVNLRNTGDTYIWENDTVGIEYSFWANRGVMAFSVYNKLDKPIYVDWKKSTYILNSYKFNYWSDDVKTETVSASQTKSATAALSNSYLKYQYVGPLIRPFVSTYGVAGSVSATSGFSSSVTSKQERITFVPPKAFIYSCRHYITAEPFNGWGTDYQKSEVPRNDKPGKTTIIFTKQFTAANSPIVFRNFLTLSTREDFATEFYVDNEFYVKEVTQMDNKHFSKDTIVNNHYEEILLYKKGTDFYRK